jgi:hydrogenase nickel incorporation protein HypB
MFRQSRCCVFTKVDLLPHVPFDMAQAERVAREVNPALSFFYTSARAGDGLDAWFDFLREQVERSRSA